MTTFIYPLCQYFDPENIIVVVQLLTQGKNENDQEIKVRERILHDLCLALRYQSGTNKVIGIAKEIYIEPINSFSFSFLDMPELTDEQKLEIKRFVEANDILSKPDSKESSIDEFPE